MPMAERHPTAFRALLSYEVSSTSDAVRRGTALRLRREHGLSLAQARMLALIESLAPVRLRDVAAEAGADKAQVSRVVTSLVAQGFVQRRTHEADARSAHLELTDDGRAKTAALGSAALARDQALRACLQPTEYEQLTGMLARVRMRAQELVDEEERLNGGGT